jgi:hypothetical protein
VSYTNDVREIGTTLFSVDKGLIKYTILDPSISAPFITMKRGEHFLETKIIPKTESF